MTKVDLTTWKSHPLGGNLFAAESKTIVVNHFDAANEKIMGVDADETWYAPVFEPKYSHNWMHLLAIIDMPEKRETRLVKDESGSESTVVPLHMINLIRHDKKLNNALLVKPNLQHVKQ